MIIKIALAALILPLDDFIPMEFKQSRAVTLEHLCVKWLLLLHHPFPSLLRII
jgi:hypothetical protein